MTTSQIPQAIVEAHAESGKQFALMRAAKGKERAIATVRYQNANAKFHDLLFAFVDVDGKPDQAKYNATKAALLGWE